MTNVVLPDLAIDVCSHCGSTWLDGGEIADYLRQYSLCPAYGAPSGGKSTAVALLEAIELVFQVTGHMGGPFP